MYETLVRQFNAYTARFTPEARAAVIGHVRGLVHELGPYPPHEFTAGALLKAVLALLAGGVDREIPKIVRTAKEAGGDAAAVVSAHA